MPTNLFISFAQEDKEQLQSFRALANNPEHELEFHDRSEIEPVKGRKGKPLTFPSGDPGANPIRKELEGSTQSWLLKAKHSYINLIT